MTHRMPDLPAWLQQAPDIEPPACAGGPVIAQCHLCGGEGWLLVAPDDTDTCFECRGESYVCYDDQE